MSEEHAHSHRHDSCGCCASMGRRDFMTTVGLSALAAQSGVFGLASAAMADPPAPAAKPRVRVAFFRPKVDRYWMGWPGACYDIKAREADYVKTMADAAEKLGVELEVDAEPIADMAAVDKLLAECKQSPPDGMIAVVGALCPDYWPHANKFAAEKGDVPTILFSPMGTSFTGHLQEPRKATRCFVAATQDYGWLATGMRMLRTIWDMKNTRLCIINGDKTDDERLAVIGTTLHYIPLEPLDRGIGQAGDDRRGQGAGRGVYEDRRRKSSSRSRRTSSTRRKTTSWPSGSWRRRTARGFR